VTLFIEKQFSYGLDMHRDLFVFLGLMVNLPSLTNSYKTKDVSKGLIDD